MSQDTDLDDARRALRHRIDGHRAALRAAEALGWPGILRASIAETEARLDEARSCLLAVDLATMARDRG
jgi:hypothetical protein